MATCLWRGRLVLAGFASVLCTASAWGGLVLDAPGWEVASPRLGSFSGHVADSTTRESVDRAFPIHTELIPAGVPLSESDLDGVFFSRVESGLVKTDMAQPDGGVLVRVAVGDNRSSAIRSIEVADGVRSAEVTVGPASNPTRIVVPEPSVLLLMLLGLPVMMRVRGRSLRRRSGCVGAELT